MSEILEMTIKGVSLYVGLYLIYRILIDLNNKKI